MPSVTRSQTRGSTATRWCRSPPATRSSAPTCTPPSPPPAMASTGTPPRVSQRLHGVTHIEPGPWSLRMASMPIRRRAICTRNPPWADEMHSRPGCEFTPLLFPKSDWRLSEQTACHAVAVVAGSRCDSLINDVYASIRGVNLYNILDSCHASDAPHRPAGAGLRASHAAVLERRLGHTPKCLASRCAQTNASASCATSIHDS